MDQPDPKAAKETTPAGGMQHRLHVSSVQLSPGRELVRWLEQTHLEDMFSTRLHSQDFSGSRGEAIAVRVRMLALALAVMIPLWIPIDSWLLDGEMLGSIILLRLLAALAYAGLALWRPVRPSLAEGRLRLGLLVGIGLVFSTGARLLLGDADGGVMAGYALLAFVLMAALAVFPLTITEGVGFAGLSLAGFLVAEGLLGRLGDAEMMSDLWLLMLIAAVALWAVASQLTMLLRLYRQATRDPLTGLVNRRVMNDRLEEEIERARRYGKPLSVLLFDLDRFKRVNDSHGHLAGDAVLQSFATMLVEALRGVDCVGRFGGEEFLVLLPETDVAVAEAVAERLRKGCHQRVVVTQSGEDVTFTTSVGVAQWRSPEDIAALLERVDQYLYEAKEAGRDCVVVAPRPEAARG